MMKRNYIAIRSHLVKEVQELSNGVTKTFREISGMKDVVVDFGFTIGTISLDLPDDIAPEKRNELKNKIEDIVNRDMSHLKGDLEQMTYLEWISEQEYRNISGK